MAISISDIRTELDAAVAVLEPQIRGLSDLTALPNSEQLQSLLDDQLVLHKRRRELIQSASDSLNSLDHDGYPSAIEVSASEAVFSELAGAITDFQAAAAGVKEQAAAMSVRMGVPVDKR